MTATADGMGPAHRRAVAPCRTGGDDGTVARESLEDLVLVHEVAPADVEVRGAERHRKAHSANEEVRVIQGACGVHP